MVSCLVTPASALLSDPWPPGVRLRRRDTGLHLSADEAPAPAARGESGSERLVRMRHTVIRLRPSSRAAVTAATPMVTP